MYPYSRFKFTFILVLLFYTSQAKYLGVSFDSSKTNLELSNPNPKSAEFRAIWIATINNIDWPSKPNLTVEQQKSEFLQLLDTFQKLNLNVVILQVRAASDAFYQSKSEPWSMFLTGKQGRAPKPFYDPLAWAVEMCHQKGMELHAWFNPFRVRNLGYYALDVSNFASIHSHYVIEYDKKLFLDPGYPEVISHLCDVIAEVASNYAIDAILLDDYFYPYPVKGKKFNDENSFRKFGKQYYPKKINDWRRENINHFISLIHDTLKQINPKIKFGISPFGIWRNKAMDIEGSSGLRGLGSYDELYADVRKWLKEGWIDYVIPQLYWEKGNHFGDFTSLVQWWSENSYGKHLYIGQALYKSTIEKNGWLQPDELNNQINFLRTNKKVSGFAFYSASNIKKLSDQQIMSLCDNQLKYEALVDDNRHASTNPIFIQSKPQPDSTNSAKLEEANIAEFLNSLEFYPISIRPNFTPVSGLITQKKLSDGGRQLTWNIQNSTEAERFALVSFKKTGDRRYLQTVERISKSPDFKLSEQQWQKLRKMDLLLVSRETEKKSDRFSHFLQLKRKHIKFVKNPFVHE